MKPLLKINEPARFSAGIWTDPPKNQPNLWVDGENVLFSDGVIEKSQGYTEEQDYDAPVTGLAVANADGIKRIYVGAGPKVFKIDDGIETEIGTGFSALGQWDIEPFGTWALLTNNVDPPKIWKNAGQIVAWPTVPFARARIVKKIADVFPVLFSGQEVAWPAYNNPEDFVPGPGKRAGQFFIRGLDGDVMAAEPLGDALVYYSQDMFGFMRFVGGEAAMSIVTHPGGGIGAVGPKAVVSAGAFHFGVSRKGIWQSDGNSFNYPMRPAVARWFNSQIDWLRGHEVVGVHHEAEEQVVFFFPCLDGVIRGLGYTYGGPAAGRWTKLRMPVTAYADQSVFKGAVIGTGQSFGFYNSGDNAGPVALSSSLRSAPLDMGSTDRFKRWQMFELHYEANGLLEFRIGYSNEAKAEPEWTAWDAVALQNWLEDRESVFITVEFRSTGFGSDWKLSGMEFYGEVTGQNR